MKLNDLFENDSRPRKKKDIGPKGSFEDMSELRLTTWRDAVSRLKKFGDSGDFGAIDVEELADAEHQTVLAVYDLKGKTIPEKSYIKIRTSWISLADGKTIKPSQIISTGRKLGDDYGWAVGHL